MCGFAALIGPGAKEQESAVRAMTESIRHRGPDDEGYFSSSDVVFGFRRLAILDLTPTGHQPMVSADGRRVIVFNGEIFNYLELRKDSRRWGTSSVRAATRRCC